MSGETAAPAAFVKRNVRALIASGALVLGLAYVLNRGALPLWPPKGTLAAVDWWLWGWMTAVMLLNVATRFVRYVFLIRPIAKISVRRVMVISGIAMGLLTFLPFRLGEVARPAMLRSKGKLSGWAVTGTVGAERVIDGVLFSAMLLLGLAFAHPHEPVPDHIGDLPVPASQVPRVAMVMALVFGASFVVMLAFFFWRNAARRLTEIVIGPVSERLATTLADTVERLSDGLKFLPNLRDTAPYLLITLISLGAQVLSFHLLLLAVGLPPIGLAELAVCNGVLAMAYALPNAPGFFGTLQLAIYAGMAIYYPPEKVVHEGAAAVFLYYVTYIVATIVIFVAGLLFEYTSPGEEPSPVSAPINS